MNHSNPIHALVVDDEPSVRGLLKAFLELDGYTVVTAEDGADGLEKFQDAVFDLVLVDRVMPRMDGCELATAIKALEPHLPIVMVSGSPACARQPIKDLSPIDAVVTKPCTIKDLREGIARAQRVHDLVPGRA